MDDAMVERVQNVLRSLPLSVQIGGVSVVALVVLLFMRSQEQSFVDLFLTADQQGRRAYENREYELAATRFIDPFWTGTAQYAAGDYAEAANSFARVGSAQGFYNRGNAFMRAFEYRKAVASYEQAVKEAPNWVDARENLELARYTLSYIERTREESDTGEEGGIGADDVVYDNSGERGTETEVSRESAVEAQSAEKWMRSVDTDTAEFLRSRFLLEASRRGLI